MNRTFIGQRKLGKTAYTPTNFELAFISKQVGERYCEIINHLEKETSWKIKIKENPNQILMSDLAKSLIPTDWIIVGDPSFYLNKSLVIARVEKIEVEKLAKIKQEFWDKSGFTLSVEKSKKKSRCSIELPN